LLTNKHPTGTEKSGGCCTYLCFAPKNGIKGDDKKAKHKDNVVGKEPGCAGQKKAGGHHVKRVTS